jgi:hypothetical protein
MLERHLAEAERHLVESDGHIDKQHAVILHLETQGLCTASAKQFLDQLLNMHELHERDRRRILRELGRAPDTAR